jgi:hypothetical protein
MDIIDNEYMSLTIDNFPNKETLENKAELYIFEYFEDIKRQVDLRREILIERIQNCSAEIIKSVENVRNECLVMSKKVDQLSIEVEKWKRNLHDVVDQFDLFNNNHKNVFGLDKSFKKVLENYKESLLGYNKYSFHFKEFDINFLFGRFDEIKKVY